MNIEVEKIRRLYIDENKTLLEVANIIGCSQTFVYNLLKKNGIKTRPRPKKKIKYFVSKEELYNLFILQNKTIKEIASQKGCSVKVINDNLKKYKIKKGKKLALERAKETNIKKYGNCNAGAFISQKNYPSEYKEIYHNKEKTEEFFKKNNKKYTREELAKIFSTTVNSIDVWAKKFDCKKYILVSVTSHYEDELEEFLKNIGCNKFLKHTRTVLKNRLELDFYIPDSKIAIEFNGTFWHSELQKEKKYHFNKSIECEALGIRLIHIWEYEWIDSLQQEKIKQLLRIALGKNEKRIFARKCVIKEITNKEAKKLNEKVHLQGHRNAQVTYGLFYKDELVQLMSFSKTRYNKNLKTDNSWEIIRGCPGSNNIVVGGVGKLFKHFIKEYNPNEIFSYCDFNKFNGKSYESIGMKFVGFTGPDMGYIINNEYYHRNPKKYKEIKNKYDYRVYGAGSKKYLWRKE